MAVSFHVGILPNRPRADFVDCIVKADELGFGGVWVADSQSVFRDAFMALALFARCTRPMELATGVTNIVTRHPAVLAHSFATLDELSGRRAVLGIGVGVLFQVGADPALVR
jgi:5,10-methylenetetrahydromethanopterin reductase